MIEYLPATRVRVMTGEWAGQLGTVLEHVPAYVSERGEDITDMYRVALDGLPADSPGVRVRMSHLLPVQVTA